MKNKKFFFKNLIIFWTMVLLLGLLFYLYSVNLIKKTKTEEQIEELSELAQALAQETTAAYRGLEEAELHSILKIQARLMRTRVSLIKPDGQVVFDTEKDYAELESHRYRPEVDRALRGEKAWSIRFSDTLQKKLIYAAVPIKKGEQIIGICRVSRFLEVAFLQYRSLRNSLVVGLLVFVLMGWGLSFLGLRLVFRPLEELTEVLEKARASQEMIVRHSLRERLGKLASGLEELANEFKRKAAAEMEEKEILNSLIVSSDEGWLVVEDNGKILLANPALRKMFPELEKGGEFVWENLRCPTLIKNLEQARQKGEKLAEEIEIAGRHYLCQAIWLAHQKRYLVSFRDISDVRDLADRKKEFIANLVHELKTPLTAINGFVETLEEEPLGEEARSYLSVIKRNAERLARLVDDLAQLSRLEEKSLVLEKEEVDLAEVAGEIIRNYERKAKEKSLSLRMEAEGNTVLQADRFQLEQLTLNLVDNAVRYTEKGEVLVRVRGREDGVILEVSDTGIGIPEEHLPRIFERFYVVDKSRSRKTGGTGLGLAIVKHIVHLHQGRIEVKSAPGTGSTFTVWLPRAGK
ncbi:MAG: ATP-binding protein [Candidatus Saccharicenans sp.]